MSKSMIEELENAGNAFREALDQYLDVCSKIDDLSLCQGVPRHIPQSYLDKLHAEIAHSPSHASKLQRTEAIVGRIRNRVAQITPIASLPLEILGHIFHLVAKPCDLVPSNLGESNSNSGFSTPTKPNHVINTCSHWRRTAITLPSLWTHIDILPHKLHQSGFVARAETYVTRAAQLPIELHIADTSPFKYDSAPFGRFLSSISTRVQSLDMAAIHGREPFHNFIFAKLFSSDGSQSICTNLTTNFAKAHYIIDDFLDCFDVIDNTFHFTALRLRGLFPGWNSKVYSNLVDLRLLTAPRDDRWTQIPEHKLRNLLEASPRLKIFHFSLQITNQQPGDTPPNPVRLDDLEVLGISTYRDPFDAILQPGYVLRLLAPGSKPLQLSIRHDFQVFDPYDDDAEEIYVHVDEFSLDELVKFFQRSNLTRFCVKDRCPELGRLLSYAPNLEDLALDSFEFSLTANNPLRHGGSCRLNSLILLKCYLSVDQMDLFLKHCPADLLTLFKCRLHSEEGLFVKGESVERLPKLLERYPATKLIFQSSNPTACWDVID
ncbi:F-box-like domain protein, putative [Rhizoctonia solani AG-3 Rhs1AP]|uniref:F-box-like domain protein, putative n=1 Tax=Rhizoctonia solani AG-3 Rhs1AP TaxID=1086054 RepID=A0A0A1UI17_9AGAM|nr:F-box-like domain protein, putative [Rhizoctonia solani AG-3 Rhs1AP]